MELKPATTTCPQFWAEGVETGILLIGMMTLEGARNSDGSQVFMLYKRKVADDHYEAGIFMGMKKFEVRYFAASTEARCEVAAREYFEKLVTDNSLTIIKAK